MGWLVGRFFGWVIGGSLFNPFISPDVNLAQKINELMSMNEMATRFLMVDDKSVKRP